MDLIVSNYDIQNPLTLSSINLVIPQATLSDPKDASSGYIPGTASIAPASIVVASKDPALRMAVMQNTASITLVGMEHFDSLGVNLLRDIAAGFVVVS